MNTFDKIIKDFLGGGLAEGLTIEDIAKKHKVSANDIQKQLEKGIKVEYEHTKNDQVAKRIAMDHLVEDAQYYDKLQKMERTVKEQMTVGSAYGAGDPSYTIGQYGGSVNPTNNDFYGPGDARIPKGGKVMRRAFPETMRNSNLWVKSKRKKKKRRVKRKKI